MFGHHILLLTLLSRSDGEAVIQEREVILHHCLEQAHNSGEPATASEAAELGDYLRDLRPTTAQLGPSIRRLEHGTKEEVIAVVTAAIALVDADGARRRAKSNSSLISVASSMRSKRPKRYTHKGCHHLLRS